MRSWLQRWPSPYAYSGNFRPVRFTKIGHTALVATLLLLAACSGTDDAGTEPGSTSSTESTSQPAPPISASDPTDTALAQSIVLAGASSRSILPTVDGDRTYLAAAPGWDDVDPDDPGVFVPRWDEGRVDVGNGRRDGSWVHDDLRSSALALQRGEERVVLVTADVYMVFAVDGDEIVRRARTMLPAEWRTAEILIGVTHNHHGPDTAFSINPTWYELFADETAAAVAEAVTFLEPASLAVAAGRHGFGIADARDPVVLDDRLNVLTVRSDETGDAIATVVQWNGHPEVTLGWTPPIDAADLDAACSEKGWSGDDCTANGRYFTADFPGVLRDRVRATLGGEVLFFNGALGNQIGPGSAPVWLVTPEHPVGSGYTVPEGALTVAGCAAYLCRNFAKTEAIGGRLTDAVLALVDAATPVEVTRLTVRTAPFFTRLTNIGFRLLIADGDLGWQDAVLFTCDGEPSETTCSDDGGELVADPVITALTGSLVRAGDVVRSQIVHLGLGDVGFLFLPGELPPELVVGVPSDFDSDPARYNRRSELHAVGAAYDFPGYLLALVDESVTFTVGLGTDELGYWVPVADQRIACLDLVLPAGTSCADLLAAGVLVTSDALPGAACRSGADIDVAFVDAVAAVCRYGQALGREFGEPDGHYEETNAAGLDLVDDLWRAAVGLFGREGSGRVNPSLPTGGWISG
jgi:hypothetical protein